MADRQLKASSTLQIMRRLWYAKSSPKNMPMTTHETDNYGCWHSLQLVFISERRSTEHTIIRSSRVEASLVVGSDPQEGQLNLWWSGYEQLQDKYSQQREQQAHADKQGRSSPTRNRRTDVLAFCSNSIPAHRWCDGTYCPSGLNKSEDLLTRQCAAAFLQMQGLFGILIGKRNVPYSFQYTAESLARIPTKRFYKETARISMLSLFKL